MERTLGELTTYLQGTVEVGDPQMVVTGVNGLQEAEKGQISFAVPPYVEMAAASKASVLVLPQGESFSGSQAVIRVENPRIAFASLLGLFRPPEGVERVMSERAFVHPTSKIGNKVAVLRVGDSAEEAEIGGNAVI